MSICDDIKLNNRSLKLDLEESSSTSSDRPDAQRCIKDRIVITDYENPTMFRYITLEDLQVNGKFVTQIELQLESFCQHCNRSKHYDFSQLVIVRYYLLGTVKYLRGKVLLSKGDGVYLVESLDYGFCFLCYDQDLWLLPLKFSHKHLDVLSGGLYGVEWSPMAIDLLQHQLETALYVMFKIRYRSKVTQHYYGQMLIKSSRHNQKSLLDAVGYLLEQNCARLDSQFLKTRNSENRARDMQSVQFNEAGLKPNPHVVFVIQLMDEINQKVELPSKDKNLTPHFNNRLSPAVKLESICLMSVPLAIPKSARKLSVVKFSHERSVNSAFISNNLSRSSTIRTSSAGLAQTSRPKTTDVDANQFPKQKLSALGKALDRKVLIIPGPKTKMFSQLQPTEAPQTLPFKPKQSIVSAETVPESKTSEQHVELKKESTFEEMSQKLPEAKTSQQQTNTIHPKESTLYKEKLDRILEEMLCSPFVDKVPCVKHLQLMNSSDLLIQEEQLLLAHSKEEVRPLSGWPRSLFDHDVNKAMREMHIQSPQSMQRYAWPHLMKGNTMLAIGSTGSGRSWCYLPMLCSLVMSSMRRTATSHEEAHKLGPLAVLLADSVDNAHLSAKHCSILMKSYETKSLKVVNTHEHSMLDVQLMLLNSCGILVTTVSHWNRLIRDTQLGIIDAHRLRHFILDDYDRMLSAGPNLLHEMLQHLQSLATTQLQLIIIAQQWHPRLLQLLTKRFNANPLVLIADFLEAAIYGHIKLDVKLLHSSRKTQQLLVYLAPHVQKRRIVVYCKDHEELVALQMALEAAGQKCIGNHDALHQNINELLLVSDSEEHPAFLPIKNCDLLVHFSLPANWSKFSNRFHAVMDNIDNCLKTQKENKRLDIVSYVMLDERNKYELPRLAQFLAGHGITVDEQVQQMVASCRRLTDQKRLFCHHMLSRGVCNQTSCKLRHFPVEDFRRPQGGLWQSGNVVRCRLIKVYNPVHFVMMAESYKSTDSDAWQAALGQSMLRQLSTALCLQMRQKQNQRMQKELSLSEICVIERSMGYQRVRIMDLSDKRLVTVQQLDEGRELLKVKRAELLQCDAAFKKIPPLAMEVRLFGLMPCDSNDGDWLPEASKWVSSQLSNLHDKQHLQLMVEFTMLDTIYVREITLLQDCPSMGISVNAMQLYSELLGRRFGRRDEQSSRSLRRTYLELFETKQEQSFPKEEFDLKIILEKSAVNDDDRDVEVKESSLNDNRKIDAKQEDQKAETKAPTVKDSSALEVFVDMLLKDLQSIEAKTKEAANNIMQEILASEAPLNQLTTGQKEAETIQEILPKSMNQAIYCAAIAGSVVRPKVRWHQTLTQIQLIFEQQVPQYQLIHNGNVLIYQAKEATPPQRCILNLLSEVQVLSELQHGYQLQVKLAKLGPITHWPTLLSSLLAQQHSHWLVYDTERAKLPQSKKSLNWTHHMQSSTQISNSFSDNGEDSNLSADDELSFTDEEF